MKREEIVEIVQEILKNNNHERFKSCAECIVNSATSLLNKRPWHPSDEAKLEQYLRLCIRDWAKNLDRTELSIKYKIAKIIKAEGVKV
jgi:hypothetical protein